MSYYSSRDNIAPGPIEGNASDGLRTRVAISVRRVLDSCSKQLSLDSARLDLKNIKPTVPTPYTFTSAASTQVSATITELRVTRLDERPCFARVRCNVVVPLKVLFKDSNCDEHSTDSQIAIPQDVVMYVPEASVFPYEIVAAASCNCMTGKFDNACECYVSAYLTVIIKVVAETDLLVPAYGYCPSPKAVDFEQQAGNKFFDLPLYPSGK